MAESRPRPLPLETLNRATPRDTSEKQPEIADIVKAIAEAK